MSIELALWVESQFPDAQEPVFSSKVSIDGKSFIRLRDSAEDFILIDTKKVPKEILKQL